MVDAYMFWRSDFVALDPERYPAEWFDAQVASGRWRCWGDDRAAILAEIKTYPSGFKEVHGVAAAGELSAILEFIERAEVWGKVNGCTRAVIESRPGWVKALPGYELHQYSVRKDLA
jgi:hypothetical protein